MPQAQPVQINAQACPRCRKHDVRRSMTRSGFERLVVQVAQLRPYRCNACLHRFWSAIRRSPMLIAS
jgi:hypothetical protein